ncbi:16S rRNA (cytosine(1402)-N(4))-methyltransferase RsmH [bacterium]|nr:MAG: 16S rRNA (cytosine(1402)-N(4))-methyltransferase RsmH [bacterium]
MTGDRAREGHVPVLLGEVLRELRIRQGGVYLDGTLGAAGHSKAILDCFSDTRIIGLDKDPEILALARAKLEGYGRRVQLYNMDFRQMETAMKDTGCMEVDGILLDLGVSSFQLDTGERGFSFSHDGPLDMRMNPADSLTAEEIVNNYSREDLKNILKWFGEERQAGKIATAIVKEREMEPIRTTKRLSRIVSAVPGMGRVKSIQRTFQAIRIEVNDELNAIEEVLPLAVDLLVSEGRLAVISFHSLEDRIVKRAFRRMESPCVCPPKLPMCTCGEVPRGSVVTKRPIVPDRREQMGNPRSRSAKLRVFEKRSLDK